MKSIVATTAVGTKFIPKYKMTHRTIEHDHKELSGDFQRFLKEHGGFDPRKKIIIPMHFESGLNELYYVLDNITAAVESGVVDSNAWSTQLFANDEALEEFLEHLENYDECYRIVDRWWTALANLVETQEELSFITCQEIVAALRESIEVGAEQAALARAELQYFSENPPKNPKLTSSQEAALFSYNSTIRKKAAKQNLDKDISFSFYFPAPIHYIKNKKLFSREVTLKEVRELIAKSKEIKPTKKQTV